MLRDSRMPDALRRARRLLQAPKNKRKRGTADDADNARIRLRHNELVIPSTSTVELKNLKRGGLSAAEPQPKKEEAKEDRKMGTEK